MLNWTVRQSKGMMGHQLQLAAAIWTFSNPHINKSVSPATLLARQEFTILNNIRAHNAPERVVGARNLSSGTNAQHLSIGFAYQNIITQKNNTDLNRTIFIIKLRKRIWSVKADCNYSMYKRTRKTHNLSYYDTVYHKH